MRQDERWMTKVRLLKEGVKITLLDDKNRSDITRHQIGE